MSKRCALPAKLLFFSAMLFTVPVLGYCLNIAVRPAAMSAAGRFLFLGSFSVLSILAFFLLYGPSDSGEVAYAIHKD